LGEQFLRGVQLFKEVEVHCNFCRFALYIKENKRGDYAAWKKIAVFVGAQASAKSSSF
jgi:hypothetical protein